MKNVYKLIIDNIHYKLLALVFAVLLWFLATNKEITEAVITVKYSPVISGDYQVVDYAPKKLKLKVEGYRKEIVQLKEEGKVRIILPPVPAEKNGWFTFKVKKEMVKLPFTTLKLKSVEPKSIKVKLEKLIRKAVPVEAELVGLKRGVSVRVVPNYAVISLPEELWGAVISVRTESVDVSDVKLPAEIEVRLKSNYRVEPKTVKIILEEGDEGKEKALRNRWNKRNSQ